MRVRVQLLIVLSLTVAFAGFHGAAALGATYHVHTCREEVRESLPTTDWSIIGSSNKFDGQVDCNSKTITAYLADPGLTGQDDGGGLRFSVPSPLAIVGIEYRQLVRTSASLYPPGRWWWDFESRQVTLDGKLSRTGGCPGRSDRCRETYARISYAPPEKLSAIDWVLRCSATSLQPCEHYTYVDVAVFDGIFTVEDLEAPRIVGQPSGAMFAGLTNLSGDQTVVFQAADRGSGIYRATVEVDGQVVGESLLGSATPTCQLPFRVSQPCPLDVTNSVVVDTMQLVDGQHDAYLKIYDATGENHALYGPVSFSTANRTLANYCGYQDASRFFMRLPTKPLRLGRGWWLRGRLRDAIGWEAVLLDGESTVSALGTAVVPATGLVRFRVPQGPNRHLRLAIRPPGSRDRFVCSRPRLLRVKPKLTLSISPTAIANKGSIILGGRLYGKARGSKAIVIQARASGSRRWATVRVVRTKRNGRYRMRYRFRSSTAGTTYVFRSQARGENGYPYATGTSPHRRLTIVGA